MLSSILQVHNIVIIACSLLVLVFFIFFKLFKLSGLILFLLTTISFIVSLLISNLFLQFLATSILLIYIFLFFYYVAVIFYYRKRDIEINSFASELIHPLKDTILVIEAKNIAISFPCVYFGLSFNIYENSHKIDTINSNVINFDAEKLKIKVKFNRHGDFFLNNFIFSFKDIFGLTEYRLNCKFNQMIKVFPYFTDIIKIPFFFDKGGEEIIQSMQKIDSTDFFDNRKYYPGDDTRRINWNIFAHSGELHIREVQKIPPKIGQISILYAPYSNNFIEYEYITSLFLSTVHYLLQYDFQLKIIAPFSEKFFLIDKTSEKDFNSIINLSYRKFEQRNIRNLEKLVVFASYEEFTKLLNYQRFKNTFCAVGYYDLEVTKKDLIKSIFYIDKTDSLIKETIINIFNYKNSKNKTRMLDWQKDISFKRELQLELYRINDDYKKIFW